MTGTMGNGGGGSTEGKSSMQLCESNEALTKWRSSEQPENGTPSTSPFWDSDDEDDSGPKPSDLYGKYTWKIDKFLQINKRELRSNAFEVGGYEWYILIYPQGCDVCNHLSLFLCVGNHDKLLPGWSHFAQFTISVVNKDPKKSKYSDTLHRFWKKEHDWGWKKFMELSKICDGFLDDDDAFIIKAQVQVIREKVKRPFRSLDFQYRRELVRVYLTNVEQVCRRFMEDRRNKLVKLIEDEPRWTSFCAFWLQIKESARQWMSREKTDIILKIVVKHFFIEKEVTSTMVMDSLYSGLRALEGRTNYKNGGAKSLLLDKTPAPIVRIEKDMFVLVDDVLPLLERAAMEPLPPKDENGPQNRTKDESSDDDSSKDTNERDERRLTELGRRTVEIFVLAHLFSNKIEVAYQEAVSLRRQEDLIMEEAESEKKIKLRSSKKDKKSNKKQAKNKRSNRNAKDKVRDEKASRGLDLQENHANELQGLMTDVELPAQVKPDRLDETSDISDSVDFAGREAQQSDSEDRGTSPVNWDTDTSENHPPAEARGGSFSLPNGITDRKSPPRMDDSSSTCSTDSIPTVNLNSLFKGNSLPQLRETCNGGKKSTHQKVGILDGSCRVNGTNSQPAQLASNTGHLTNDVGSCKVAALPDLESVLSNQNLEKLCALHTTNKNVVSLPNKPIIGEKSMVAPSGLVSPSKICAPPPQSKSVASKISGLDPDAARKKFSLNSNPSGQPVSLASALPGKTNSRPDTKPLSGPKSAENPVVPLLSRPSCAPVVPAPRPVTPAVSTAKATPHFVRSVSGAGLLGPEALSSSAHSFIPQSYRNAMMGSMESASSSSLSNAPSSSVSTSLAYMNLSTSASSPALLTSNLNVMDQNAVSSGFTFSGAAAAAAAAAAPGVPNNGNQWMETSLRDTITRNTYAEASSLAGDMQNLNLHNMLRSGSLEYIPRAFQAPLTGREVQGPSPDEFPHLDIINDLLDDEFAIRNTGSPSRSFHSFSCGSGNRSFHQLLNRQLSFPNETSFSGDLASSTSSVRSGRTLSCGNDGFHRSFMAYGSQYDPIMSQGSSELNFQLPSYEVHSQLKMSNTEGDFADGYMYGVPDYSSFTGVGNGNEYESFRSANGR